MICEYKDNLIIVGSGSMNRIEKLRGYIDEILLNMQDVEERR
ncbi:hypothetical protein [Clostridium sp. CF012]|nr:hypothetical protein [Clostridium sp. CF012]